MLVRGVMSETGKEEAMRERWKKIRTGTLTIAFIIIEIGRASGRERVSSPV